MANKYMTRTVKVSLDVDDDIRERLLKTIDIYAQVFNKHAKWAQENKSTNVNKAHKELYESIRQEYPEFPSAMIQLARNHAFGNIKSYNSNNPKSKWSKVLTYRARSMKYNRLTVSMNTLGTMTFSLAYGKRGKCNVEIPKYFTDRYGNWEFNSASIGIDKNGQAFASLSFRKVTTPLKENGKVIGVDRGIYNIATTSEGKNYSSKHVRGIKRKYQYNRSTLQAKVAQGSRSAKRRLKAQRGKEARFSKNELSKIVNNIVDDGNIKVVVIEDLTGLHQKRRSKSFNRLKNTWSPAMFESLLRNKCEILGIEVVSVDPKYTSHECNGCSHIDKKNRKSSVFKCIRCGHVDHADINGSKNIRDRYVSTLPVDEDGVVQGASQSPNDAPSHREVVASHGACPRDN